jgi:hypothetical protein
MRVVVTKVGDDVNCTSAYATSRSNIDTINARKLKIGTVNNANTPSISPHFGSSPSGVRRSMGRRATCFDNAAAESFFATYKKELIHTRPWGDLTEVQQHTFLWIEGYYNRRRRALHTEILDTPRI